MYASLGAGRVDSTSASIDFLLSEIRDLISARRFFQKALAAPGHPRPRVINVDGNPSYPNVIEQLKQERALRRRCVRSYLGWGRYSLITITIPGPIC
jgi:transposase-like protein